MDFEARYEFLDKIGSGSFATVYRARDNELGREVAIKQIHEQYLQDPQQLNRYWQESQLLASLQHPNIVTIFDIDRQRGWLILELMQANLAQRMAGRQMNLTSLRTTIAHSLRALKYLHSRGIVHGDIKLSNLMIDARRRVKIGDFGLARRVSDEEGSMLKGTTKYMAPEAISDEFGELGPASDLYSLGFCAYELMCGPNFESLFPGLDAHSRNIQGAWLMWHAAADRRLPNIHKVLEGVPDDLTHVIGKLCEKDQSKRYLTADEALSDLKIDLKLVQQGNSTGDDDLTAAKPATDRKRLLIAGVAMLVSIIISALMLFSSSGDGAGSVNAARLKAGFVQSVDSSDGKLVIVGTEDAVPEELELGKRPRIFLVNEKKYILLRELKPRDRVELEYKIDNAGKQILELIVARPVTNRGKIRAVDLPNGRVKVSIEEGARREVLTLNVPQWLQPILNGQDKPLRDLQEGDRVTFSHLAELGGRGSRVVTDLQATRQMQKVGFVAGVDLDRGEMTVKFGKGNNSSTQTLPFAKECKITLKVDRAANHPIELRPADLRQDDRVRYRYDVAFLEIEVTRDKPKMSGVVREVRAEQGHLVLSQEGTGKLMTFQVEPDREVTLSLTPITLADLREFDEVVITYDQLSDKRLSAATIDATRPVRTDRWAIVVGVQSYRDTFLSPLRYSIRNAKHVRQALVSRYAFSEDRILMLLDESRDEMRNKIIELLANAAAPTQVLMYVSSHAYVDTDGSVYLAGSDFSFDEMAETGLSLDWLVEQLEACRSKDKILLLDCSHLGNQMDLDSQPSTATMIRKLKTVRKSTFLIASCDEGQRGIDWKAKQLGLFAFSIAEAFSGRADLTGQHRYTAQDVFRSLKNSMSSVNFEGRTQTPVDFSPQ